MENTLKTIMKAAERRLNKIAEDIERNGGDFRCSQQLDDALDLIKVHEKSKEHIKAI